MARRGNKLWNQNEELRCDGLAGAPLCRANYYPLEYSPTYLAEAGLAAAVGQPVDQFMEDASFVKLRELSATYFIPTRFLSVTNPSITFAARELHTWTNYGGIDPEAAAQIDDDERRRHCDRSRCDAAAHAFPRDLQLLLVTHATNTSLRHHAGGGRRLQRSHHAHAIQPRRAVDRHRLHAAQRASSSSTARSAISNAPSLATSSAPASSPTSWPTASLTPRTSTTTAAR